MVSLQGSIEEGRAVQRCIACICIRQYRFHTMNRTSSQAIGKQGKRWVQRNELHIEYTNVGHICKTIPLISVTNSTMCTPKEVHLHNHLEVSCQAAFLSRKMN